MKALLVWGGRWATCLIIICLGLTACAQEKDEKLRIAISPWPGYEVFYLAKEKGFFAAQGLDVEIIELGSIDAQANAFLSGDVDLVCTTLFDLLLLNEVFTKESSAQEREEMSILLAIDYSNGGDVLVTQPGIKSVAELAGKTIGVEFSALGDYVLTRALAKHGLSKKDVSIYPAKLGTMDNAVKLGKIQAAVSYPPYSTELENKYQWHRVFNSKEIPFEIIDILSARAGLLEDRPDLYGQLLKVWGMSLDSIQQEPGEAHRIMAAREGISAEDFAAAISGLQFISMSDQSLMFDRESRLHQAITSIHQGMLEKEVLSMPLPEHRFIPLIDAGL